LQPCSTAEQLSSRDKEPIGAIMYTLNLTQAIIYFDRQGSTTLADKLNLNLQQYQEKKIDLGDLIRSVASILKIDCDFVLTGIEHN